MPKTSANITIIGILGIIYATVMILGRLSGNVQVLHASGPLADALRSDSAFVSLFITSAVGGYAFNILMLVASVGALKRKPWARWGINVYAVGSILLIIMDAIISFYYVLPRVAAKMFFAIFAIFGLLLYLAIACVILVVLNRRVVANAFKGIEPVVPGEAEVPATMNIPIQWRLVRGVGKLLTLFGAAFFVQVSIRMVFEVGNSSALVLAAILELAQFIAMLGGGICLVWFASAQVSTIDTMVENLASKSVSLSGRKPNPDAIYSQLVFVTAVGLLPFIRDIASYNHVLPSVVSLIDNLPGFFLYICWFAGIIGGLERLLRIRRFVWRRYLIAVMAVVLPVASISVLVQVRARTRPPAATQSMLIELIPPHASPPRPPPRQAATV
jgi:hypothetical protein